MKKNSIYFLILFLTANSLHAQWKNVAPNLLAPLYHGNGFDQWGGASCFRDGILWFGKDNLYFSLDTGKTWTFSPIGGITSIDFFDRFHGLVTDTSGDLQYTQDGGTSWTNISEDTGHFLFGGVAFFLGSPQVIIFNRYDQYLHISRDEGKTWSTYDLGFNILTPQRTPNVMSDGKWIGGGSAYISIADYSQDIGKDRSQILKTTDYGNTWQNTGGSSAWDSYSFDFDRCDTNFIYSVNENNEGGTIFCNIFVSGNAGKTWQTKFTQRVAYLCGSIQATDGVIFAQTIPNGVLRSTDKGQTWHSIHGPNSSYDARFLTAINKNILFAVDSQGSIWSTFNSGGDSLSFRIITSDQKTDTIGGTVAVPLSFAGLNDTQDINIVIHYDTSLLYQGTYSLSNVRLDMPGESWKGRSKIHIQKANSFDTLAYSYFIVFSDSSQKTKVVFDSVDIVGAPAMNLCEPLSIPITTSATATITPPSGCGVQTITRFMLHGTLPQLNITPNPASGEVFISSTLDLGDVNVSIYDMLGVKQNESVVRLQKNNPVKMVLLPENGLYNLRVKSTERTYNLRVIISR